MTVQERKFLIFTLKGSLYAIDLAQVAEVGDPPGISPIPMAPKCYNGALNFHGEIVAVMDLALFLGLSGEGTLGKIVVLHHKVASLAFLIDSIVRIIFESEVNSDKPTENRFAPNSISTPVGEAYLLDLGVIVNAAEEIMQNKAML